MADISRPIPLETELPVARTKDRHAHDTRSDLPTELSTVFDLQTIGSGASSKYCHVCERFELERADSALYYFSPFHISGLPELRKQADSGCFFCSLLAEATAISIRNSCPDQMERSRSIRRYFSSDRRETLHFELLDDEEAGLGEFDIYCKTGSCRAILLRLVYVKTKQAPGNASPCGAISVRIQQNFTPFDDDLSFQTAKRWLAKCKESHNACRQSQTPLLPTRVIEVGDDPTGDPCKLHLSAVGERQHYLALSHCWGDPSTVPKTERANLLQHQKAIPITSLSQTFRDALRVTRELGYRYVWIDSICIVQDDPEDWDRESASMATVYGNADLTIAAASAADGSAGFLKSKQGWGSEYLTESLACGAELFVQGRLSHLLVDMLRFSWTRETSATLKGRTPLLMRKWCVQERILSPRVLYYSFDDLVWECRSVLRCECDDSEDTQLRGNAESSKTRFDDQFRASPEAPNSALQNGDKLMTLKVWKEIVTQYSRAQLTYPTDILPALSGVAERASSRFKGDYCAGLWTSSLLELSLWQSEAVADTRHTRPAEYCAPTWSWASVQGPVSYAFKGPWSSHCYDAVVVSVDCTASSQTTTRPTTAFGRVSSGMLTLSARALTVRVCNMDPHGPWRLVNFAGVEGRHLLHLDTDDDAIGLVGRTIWLLCIATTNDESYKNGGFLVLLQQEDGATEHETFYRRIGIFEEDSRPGEDSFCAKIEHVARREYRII